MEVRVTQFIKENQLLTPGSTVLIGVSGGPDSVALLHYYHTIREKWNLQLIAVSVDHQLRGEESKEDVSYVRKMCEEWGVKFVEESVDVPAYKEERKISTQLAAREMRYQAFLKHMHMNKADYLALGHHGDDQIETMLMGFSRSTSIAALSGIPVTRYFHGGKIVRPFLCVTKSDIKAYCAQHKIIPRIDPSNEDVSYTRNYFREQIIPHIKEKNKNLHTTVQRLSKSLQEDNEYLLERAFDIFKKDVSFNEACKEATLNIKQFKSNPQALQRRVYHLILGYLYFTIPKSLTYVHEDVFFALLEEKQGNGVVDFPEQLQIERSYETLTFYFKHIKPQASTYQQILQIPGIAELPNGSKLNLSYTDQLLAQDNHVFVCAMEEVSLPLSVRTRQPGDRMSWQGLNGTKKIKDVFIDAKIPRKARDTWPVVVDNDGEILWLVGLRKGKQSFCTKGKPLYIVLKYEAGDNLGGK